MKLLARGDRRPTGSRNLEDDDDDDGGSGSGPGPGHDHDNADDECERSCESKFVGSSQFLTTTWEVRNNRAGRPASLFEWPLIVNPRARRCKLKWGCGNGGAVKLYSNARLVSSLALTVAGTRTGHVRQPMRKQVGGSKRERGASFARTSGSGPEEGHHGGGAAAAAASAARPREGPLFLAGISL